jgi:nucleoside-specific outer membrane channel protein Tsx
MTALIRSLTLIALATGTTATLAADWSDTYLGYRTGPRYREPANPNAIEKDIVQFTHASGYKYGTNFLNVDTLISEKVDGANRAAGSPAVTGAQEIYITYRHQVSLGKTTGLPTAIGLLRDVGLTAGFDLNSKNTTFAPRKRALVVGPTLRLDVPGFLDVSLLYYKESNYRGIGTGANSNFKATYMATASWGTPFAVAGAPFKFQGFVNYTGDKGTDYTGVQTAPELLLRTSLMLDVGALAFDKKNSLWAGVGYEYWRNKFGNQPSVVGSKVSTPQAQLEYHF